MAVGLDGQERGLRGGAAGNDTAAGSGRREGVEQHFRFGVIRTTIERRVQFACRAGAIASQGKSHSHIEVVVRVAGIVLNRSLEIIGCFFLAAAGGDASEVVIYLRPKQSGGSARQRARSAPARSL